jgi:hypothetical protein
MNLLDIKGAGYFRDPLKDPYLTALGLVLLVIGILVLAAVKTAKEEPTEQTEDTKSLLNKDTVGVTESHNYSQANNDTNNNNAREESFNQFWDPYTVKQEQQVTEEQKEISPIIEEEPIQKPTGNKFVAFIKKSLPFILGILCVIGCGAFNGSMMVPARHNDDPQTKGIVYLVSFGIGVGCVTPVLFVLYFLVKRELPKFHVKVALLPGLCTGTIWSIANVGTTYAVLSPLGLTVGFPLSQACLIVSGLWAIIVFKEIRGWKPILHFFAALVLFLGPGCALLALYGKK